MNDRTKHRIWWAGDVLLFTAVLLLLTVWMIVGMLAFDESFNGSNHLVDKLGYMVMSAVFSGAIGLTLRSLKFK